MIWGFGILVGMGRRKPLQLVMNGGKPKFRYVLFNENRVFMQVSLLFFYFFMCDFVSISFLFVYDSLNGFSADTAHIDLTPNRGDFN